MAHIAHCLLDILRYKAHEPLILSESDEVIHGTYVCLSSLSPIMPHPPASFPFLPTPLFPPTLLLLPGPPIP